MGTLPSKKNDIKILTQRTGKFVLADDLNARHSIWGNTRNNQNRTSHRCSSRALYYHALSCIIAQAHVLFPSRGWMNTEHLSLTFDLNSSINHRELCRRKIYPPIETYTPPKTSAKPCSRLPARSTKPRTGSFQPR